jgi:hypothetical protein
VGCGAEDAGDDVVVDVCLFQLYGSTLESGHAASSIIQSA